MKKRICLILFYWLPVVVVAAMIFTASSQPYEQQDLRPYLSQVTDLEKMKNMYDQLKVEHVWHRAYVEENGLIKTIALVVEKGKWLVGFLSILILIALGLAFRFSVAYIRKKGSKKFVRNLGGLVVLSFISIVLVMVGVLFAFRVEEALLYVKEQLAGERTRQILRGIEFSYGGNMVSVERSGLESFIEFFIRKAAHFSFFFVLGFLMYRALLVSGCKKAGSYISSLVFVLLYAISDEIHQAFTPNRSPLVEDVILDFAGGMTGVTMALLLYWFLQSKKKRKPFVSARASTAGAANRRYKG
jgi:VanZ family protein